MTARSADAGFGFSHLKWSHGGIPGNVVDPKFFSLCRRIQERVKREKSGAEETMRKRCARFRGNLPAGKSQKKRQRSTQSIFFKRSQIPILLDPKNQMPRFAAIICISVCNSNDVKMLTFTLKLSS